MPTIEEILDIIGELDGGGLTVTDEDEIQRGLEESGYSHDTNLYAEPSGDEEVIYV